MQIQVYVRHLVYKPSLYIIKENKYGISFFHIIISLLLLSNIIIVSALHFFL